ncbi:hypothetical protein [Nocardioides sp. P5_C9_2]
MKKIIQMLAVVLALVLAPSAAFADQGAEAKYGTGSFTVKSLTLPAQYGCFYHPYTVNLTLGWETTDWSLDVRITAPNGTIFDEASASEFGTVGGTRSLSGEIFFCSSQTAPGTYTMTGVLDTYEGASDYTPTAQSLAPMQFTVSPYVAPTPPPPPAPAPVPAPAPAPAPAPVVYADVTGKVSSKAITDGAKLTFKSNALPSGATQRKALTWTVIADGKIKKTFTQQASNARNVTVRFKNKTGKHVINVLRNGKVAKTVRVTA